MPSCYMLEPFFGVPVSFLLANLPVDLVSFFALGAVLFFASQLSQSSPCLVLRPRVLQSYSKPTPLT